MPVFVAKKKKKGMGRFVVRDHGGKEYGTHPTRKEAEAQAAAININLHKKGKI